MAGSVEWNGRPERPDVEGFHWVLTPDGEEAPYLWRPAGECERGHWPDGWVYAANEWNPVACTYLGPCLPPADLSARIAAAVQAERAACEQEACDACDPPGLKNDYEAQIADDAREMVMDAIRARGPTDALSAALAKARAEGMEAAAKMVDCGCPPERKASAVQCSPNSGSRWTFCGEGNCGAIEAAAIRAQIKQGGTP